MNKPITRKMIPRTASGLRDALFETMERLRDRELDADEAKAMALIAKAILDSVSVQITFEGGKLDSKLPAHLPDMSLVPPITVIENKRDGT